MTTSLVEIFELMVLTRGIRSQLHTRITWTKGTTSQISTCRCRCCCFTAEVTFGQKYITCQMAVLVLQMAKQLREFLSNSSSKKKSTGRTIPSLRPHSDQIRHCCNEHRVVWQSGKTQLGAHHCLVCELCLYCTLFPVPGLGATALSLSSPESED